VILVDAAPNGKTGLVGTASGKIYIKGISVVGTDEDGDEDDMSP